MDHRVKGKPLAECTADELHSEWEAGMFMDAQEGLNAEQGARLYAVEAAMIAAQQREEAAAQSK